MRAVGEGSARSHGDTNAMLIHFASHALNEFWALFCLGTPMWLPAPGGEVEMLNLQQYINTMLPSVFGPYRVGFSVDGTRKTGDVMCAARNLVGILMDAALWSDVFPGIVGSASASRIIVAPGSASSSSQNGTLLLMDADLRVLSPRVPIRKVKFVRQCQEVQPGKWAVVDVSVDGVLSVPPAHITCRLRPSGCLIEERNDSFCKVTWIMNMEYNDANVFPLYHPLLRSGKALGACRWLVSLQRYCEHLDILHTYTVPALSNTGDITPIVRKNIFEVAHRMTKSLYEVMCVPWSQPWRTYNEWSSECGIGVKRFKVVARILTFSAGSGAPREQAAGAIVLRASTPIWFPGIPAQQVFGYLCDEKRRGEWDSLANDAPVLQEVCFATGKLPGNAVSVLRTAASDGTKGKLILQEVCADTSCMVLAYSTLDEQSLQHAMNNGGTASLSLLPSGLVILPDCASPVSAACSSSAAVNAGCFVSAIYQTQLNVQPPEELFFEDARNNAGNLLCRVISKIKDAVHANFAVHAA
uniref:Uncharacterized protein n=1 Tax=Avena sativa TaxID=4498 RepID=A0ACD5YS49_AVESA